MSLSSIELEQIFLRALESPVGIAVETNNVALLKTKCYAVRTEARKRGDTTYDRLSFKTSPVNSESELWIIKAGEKADASAERES